MKKYRIKVIEDKGGNKEYIPQYKSDWDEMILKVIFSPIAYPLCLPSMLAYGNDYFWDRFTKTGVGWVSCKSEEEARAVIDEDKAKELKSKMSETKKIDYIEA